MQGGWRGWHCNIHCNRCAVERPGDLEGKRSGTEQIVAARDWWVADWALRPHYRVDYIGHSGHDCRGCNYVLNS
jgi:hypothetical protein